MPRPILLTIRIDAMRHNLSVIRNRVGRSRIWAVAKADAYGHGVEQAVRAFGSADGLAVLDLAEAAVAREMGWTKPILMIEGAFGEHDLSEMVRLGLTPVITSVEQAKDFLAAERVPPMAWIKLNTGMNRLGFPTQGKPEALAGLVQGVNARLGHGAGLLMHFACADSPDGWQSQLAEFERVRLWLGDGSPSWSPPVSLANSAAVFSLPQSHGDWVRPGISLYGGTPFEDGLLSHSAAGLGLRPAQSLTSRVIAVQEISPGDAVGYGARWRANRRSRIGVLAAGYADGYPRSAPDGTPVWIAGRRVPLVGRVSMDLITVDLTDHPQAGAGAAVELWGEHLPIDEVARSCGTIGYELMTAVTPRVRREVIDGER